ncbi:hypothetical protein LTS10_007094 [Elasticomyces elasticus]|nr:hypothetical protein LTS10_007094 [Elasticomyces elasticus]
MAGTKRRQDDEIRTSKKLRVASIASRAVTRQSTRQAAINAVFLTTELLEGILHQLPMKDLLLAQRISRRFRDVIGQSVILQQDLFMQPREADFAWKILETPGKWDKLQKITVKGCNGQDFTKREVHLSGQVNEVIFKRLQDHGMLWRHENERFLRFIFSRPLAPWWEGGEGVSWRKMFVTQPPATFMVARIFRSDYGDLIEVTIHCETGVTAGQMMDTLSKNCTSGVKSIYEFRTDMKEYPSSEEMDADVLEWSEDDEGSEEEGESEGG